MILACQKIIQVKLSAMILSAAGAPSNSHPSTPTHGGLRHHTQSFIQPPSSNNGYIKYNQNHPSQHLISKVTQGARGFFLHLAFRMI